MWLDRPTEDLPKITVGLHWHESTFSWEARNNALKFTKFIASCEKWWEHYVSENGLVGDTYWSDLREGLSVAGLGVVAGPTRAVQPIDAQGRQPAVDPGEEAVEDAEIRRAVQQ